jgi:Tc toxin complex TcA C-terminal TcB-binding domain
LAICTAFSSGALASQKQHQWHDLASPLDPVDPAGLAVVDDALLVNGGRAYETLTLAPSGPKLLASGRINWMLRLPEHPVGQGEASLDDFAAKQGQAVAATSTGDFVRAYLQEWFFYIPLLMARGLSDEGHHQEAVDWLHCVYYPYRSDSRARLIFYGLTTPQAPEPALRDTVAWQEDPFDPHVLVGLRPGALLRCVLLAHVETLLDWADRLFARDTNESVNRAREVYELALGLLGVDELAGDRCVPQLQALARQIRHSHGVSDSRALIDAISPLSNLDDPARLEEALLQIRGELQADRPAPERAQRIRALAVDANPRDGSRPGAVTLGGVLMARADSDRLLTVERDVFGTLELAGVAATVRSDAWGDTAPASLGARRPPWVPETLAPVGFCVPPNPLLDTLRFRAQSNLAKIRTCRSFGGLKRRLQPYASPVDPRQAVRQAAAGDDDFDLTASEPPPVYRYSFLLERARFALNLAKTTEQAMQTALEQNEHKAYELERARDDLALTKADVRLREMNVSKAQDDIFLAQLQQQKAIFQKGRWEDLLKEDLLGWEQATLTLMVVAAASHTAAALAHSVAAIYQFDINKVALTATSLASALSSVGQASSTWAAWAAQVATFERRKQDWQFQRDLAIHDAAIADQSITIAEDHEAIAAQERDVAALRSQFAEDTVSFLTNQFFTQELYGWMARTLRGIYRQYLNTAISMARMAQQALSFERQEPVSFVQPISEYWKSERKGLLAAELLEVDLAKLDNHRVNTERRKRELTKIIPLAMAAPSEFQQLRDTGVMEFMTRMDWFDADFPGHHMRLIKSVNLTFVALIPPTEGIHATLSNAGLSYVMVGAPFEAPQVVLHQPEAISLTVPNNGTGLFELSFDDPLMLPFEGRGVETSWTLELLPATNQIDFNTLADVLMTVQYTALEDWGYRQLLLHRRGPEVEDPVTRRKYIQASSDLQSFFSARHRFPDGWYDFNNPQLAADGPVGQAPAPYTLRFALGAVDFPPNREVYSVRRVTVVIGGAAPGRIPVEVSFAPIAGGKTYTETGEVVDGRWPLSETLALPLKSLTPMGSWSVRVRNEAALAPVYPALFTTEELTPGRRILDLDWVTDVLLVVEYRARTRYPVS